MRTSPICAIGLRARAGPTSRRSSRGRPAPAWRTARRSPIIGAHGFDWRAWEAKLNGFRQFTVPIARHRPALHPRPGQEAGRTAAADLARLAGIGVRVPQADLRCSPSISRLLRRRCPATRCRSSPGSSASASSDIADLYAELMTDVLGYKRFGVQGGDWGCFVASVHGPPLSPSA